MKRKGSKIAVISAVSVLIILLVSICADTVFAAEKGKITLNDVSGKPGEDVKLELTLSDNPGFISANLYLTYDTELLKLKEVEDGGLLSGVSHSDDLTSPYSLAWINDLRTEDFTVNGTLATLTFEIVGDTDDKADIKVEQDIIDARLNTVVFDVNTPSVTIIGGTPSAKKPAEDGNNSDAVSIEANPSGGQSDSGESDSSDSSADRVITQTDADGNPIEGAPRYIIDENGETVEIIPVDDARSASTATDSEAAKGNTGRSLWLWILIVILVVAVIIAAIIYKKKSEKSAKPDSSIGEEEASADDADK